MMFPENALFGFTLMGLADEIAIHPAVALNPLPCDRWVARSALQKSCRRGDVETAQRALATLFVHDRVATWRHIVVIALEDVGVADIDVLARIVAARLDRNWRDQIGGDWRVLAELVREMATAKHCQAACDLLLRATNAPALADCRKEALATDAFDLAATIRDASAAIEERAIAVLALGGGLIDRQPRTDPTRAFCNLAGAGCASHVIAVCQAAWRASRNPMALLLPLVWPEWMSHDGHYEVRDDQFTSAMIADGIPACALDQFTRIGGQAIRAYLKTDVEMRRLLADEGVPASRQPKIVGDLIFLSEGSAVSRRAVWPLGDRLRLPYRQLPAVAVLGDQLKTAIEHICNQASAIAMVRESNFHSGA